MKIVVYAICRNEEKFAARWMASMREADEVVELDTGSIDGTAERLRALGAAVTEERVEPWRFDTARNRSLELVPMDADICVCTDLDECFHPGWRTKLEAAWHDGVRRVQYRYTWSFQPDGTEGHVFWIDKIHARQGFRWVNPVHEVLAWDGEGDCPTIFVEGIQLDHHPDPEKSRAQYLPLLELAVREDPHNDRNRHYLGREYLFRGDWARCRETLRQHLAMPEAVWADERCASMRYLAQASEQLGMTGEAEAWHQRSLAEAPHLREPWLDYARFLYRQEDWEGVLFTTGRALVITERPRTYISEADSWGSLPYDLASLACYRLGLYARSLEMVERALAIAPTDERLRNNREWILEAISS